MKEGEKKHKQEVLFKKKREWHDDDYLNIAEFNAMYWEGN